MERLPSIDEDKIIEVLISASSENDYRFDFKELASILNYTVRKATGQYREDSDLFTALFRNELHDYVMRKGINDKKARDEKRCVSFAIPTRI